ncbi:MAG: glycine--tRNA ligase subunit beta [Gammaproteobacteria bacterium]|nr:glycine--tRNA ligase subunit beta [Gammaproteobacteria bacterium]
MSYRDLLIEVGTEELPPKTLESMSLALEDSITKSLKDEDLNFESTMPFATPRRLAVLVKELSESQTDKKISRVGPSLAAAFDESGSPTPAAIGFAKSCGVDVSKLSNVKQKGIEKLAFSLTKKGQQTIDLIPNVVRTALTSLPTEKKMRWGDSKEEFVRPIHWLLLLFGYDVVKVKIYDINSSSETWGHRFHCNKQLSVGKAGDYEALLEKEGHVVPRFQKRKELVRSLVVEEAKKANALAVIEEDLLREVASLVEYPVALLGDFDSAFLGVPPEALILAMKSHQKCFYLVDHAGNLLPKFITVSNIVSKNPALVIKGNERVIRPRLADAQFFFDTDKLQTLESRQDSLQKLIFQEKLGSVFQKSQRVASLSKSMAKLLGYSTEDCEKAARLCKCDLVTDMVREFSDLQGVVGSYYAKYDGESEEVCHAVREHYLPKFSGDKLPETTTGSVVAIADKLDTIVGLFGIGRPPTGSKDPFALRRAAIGVFRIVIEKELDLNILKMIEEAYGNYSQISLASDTVDLVFEFLLERFRSWCLERNIPTEVFHSVLTVYPERPLNFYTRIRAVDNFRRSPESKTLAAANKRVANLLSKHESEIKNEYCKEELLMSETEQSLYTAIKNKKIDVAPYYENEDYTKALLALSSLDGLVDKFFESVLVISEDAALRKNRLCLLRELRDLFLQTADISFLDHT